ncbi:AraC family transcriptional regulator [Massilia sp. HP4]|uniref:AraC family transcriptional regulator n=1 Tax=Massilia sp. HP4 TaxID=2562316 RepID=UPI001E5B8E00|nr:AraC family transcriptional regulator [Massilia sp. HP4]
MSSIHESRTSRWTAAPTGGTLVAMNQELLDAVAAYARAHANRDGLALTCVPGLRMMCLAQPGDKLESTYRPLVCLVLQGEKHLLAGRQEKLCAEGQAIVVSADLPVTGQVVTASTERPYIALAIELDMALLSELADQLHKVATETPPPAPDPAVTMLVQGADAAILDCARRLMHLVAHPEAVPILHPGLMRELHFWLLNGQHGRQLRASMAQDAHPVRLNRAVALLRLSYHQKLRVDDLAQAASMSLSAFHKHFKDYTSLTPVQYQKRLRLIEARRLMLYEGATANKAAFEVGYESTSQFTREYARLFGAPPRRDARRPATVAAPELAA